MNIRFPKGVKTITLDKSDRAAMEKASKLCAELAVQLTDDDELEVVAIDTAHGLSKILAEFPADAAQPKPEAAGEGEE